jgi:ATP-dependent DNA helicase RecG
MEIIELVQTLSRGEDSRTQFKRNFNNPETLAAEMIAFSNGEGGTIFVGVEDSGVITGLSSDDIRCLNQMISNVASQHILPAINPTTENIDTDQGLVLVIHICRGINKPYQDKSGTFWVKSGADKRKATSREEIQRLFQSAGLLHADEVIENNIPISELDIDYFSTFFEKRYHETIEQKSLPLEKLVQNLNLGKNSCLNLSGVLLFAMSPSDKLPAFIVKAGVFKGTTLAIDHYNDSQDIKGKMADIFRQTVNFIIANLHHIQNGQSVNSLGEPEIPPVAIEEIVANALIHRDYFISAPIRVFVFTDRVEIISPGHLPNNLTVENIRAGNSNMRNPVLASFANQLLPYRGFGSGILRALEAYSRIDFFDDREGNIFKVILRRKSNG